MFAWKVKLFSKTVKHQKKQMDSGHVEIFEYEIYRCSTRWVFWLLAEVTVLFANTQYIHTSTFDHQNLTMTYTYGKHEKCNLHY